MPQRILGLDVGTYSVKVAEVTRGFKSFELVHFYEKPVQYNDVLSKEESMTAAIQAVLEDNMLQWDDIICALPGEKVSTRLITLPFGNLRKINQTVDFEIEEYVPFDMADVLFDYCVNVVDKNLSKVLVSYANKGEFVKYLAILNNAGVDPRIICVEGAEFINLMHFGLVPPESSYAIVDIGHSKTTVTIGKGKKLRLTRVIPIAGAHINEAVCAELHVPADEAAKLKVEAGHISVDDLEDADQLTKGLSKAIKETIDELMVHIRQTFFSYRDDEGEPVAAVYLSGGTSRLPGLDQYMSYRLRLNVTFLDCTDFHFSRLDKSEVHPQVITQALSLALRGVAMGGGSRINFRTGEFAYRGRTKKFGGGARSIVTALCIVLFLGVVYFGTQYCALSKKNAAISEDISAIIAQALPKAKKGAKGDIVQLKKEKKEVEERMGKLSEGIPKITFLDVLREISARLPPRDELKLDIADVSMTSERATMEGSTAKFEDVDRIVAALQGGDKEKGVFKSVAKGNKVAKGVKGEIKFDIIFELNPEFEKEVKKEAAEAGRSAGEKKAEKEGVKEMENEIKKETKKEAVKEGGKEAEKEAGKEGEE